jgi:hypothetical protein
MAAVSLVLALLASACSSKHFLKVHYQLPSESQALEGEKVSLAVTDIRTNRTFLTQNAKKSLKDFNGTFSLVVLREDGSGNLVGAYDLMALITEAFQQRLQSVGLEVVDAEDINVPMLEIQLKQFQLDLADRKWIVSINYQASLKKNGDVLAGQSVNGSAERLKVMGKSEAEKILGELLTDMVNKLDVVKLFQQVR